MEKCKNNNNNIENNLCNSTVLATPAWRLRGLKGVRVTGVDTREVDGGVYTHRLGHTHQPCFLRSNAGIQGCTLIGKLPLSVLNLLDLLFVVLLQPQRYTISCPTRPLEAHLVCMFPVPAVLLGLHQPPLHTGGLLLSPCHSQLPASYILFPPHQGRIH